MRAETTTTGAIGTGISLPVGAPRRVKVRRKKRRNRFTPVDLGDMRERRYLPRVGDRFEWETLGGCRYRGTVTELDSNVIVVACDDGVERCVEG